MWGKTRPELNQIGITNDLSLHEANVITTQFDNINKNNK